MKINGAGKAYNTITDAEGKKATIPVYSANTSEVKIDGAGKAYINIKDENGKEGIAPVVSILENEGSSTEVTYEEGIWTPIIIGDLTAGTANYKDQIGVYTKIGNQVTISCEINGTFTIKPTGAPMITGIPFLTKNTSTSKGLMRHMDDKAIAILTRQKNAIEFRTTNGFSNTAAANLKFGTTISDEQFSMYIFLTYLTN